MQQPDRSGCPATGGPHVLRFDGAALAAAGYESPSLLGRSRGSEPAREMKLLVDERQAREIETRLRPFLMLDRHANPAEGNGYCLSTLYCDTPGLDVFHRRGRYRLFKFRLRRYGLASEVYLERKSKQGTQVRKRRTLVDLADLDKFNLSATHQDFPSKTWDGAWYQRQVTRNRLQPVCLIQYQRVAYFGESSAGPIRLTFDRNLRGGLCREWSFDPPSSSTQFMPGMVVCEFKFRAALPAMFKSVLQSLSLTPHGVSKYRSCLHACGIVENGNREYA